MLGQQQAVMDLAQFMSATPVYQDLRKSVEELKKNPNLFKELRELRAAAQGASNSQEQMERLGREYQRLVQIPEVRSYFQASDRYGEVIGGIVGEVNAMMEQSLGL